MCWSYTDAEAHFRSFLEPAFQVGNTVNFTHLG